MEASDMGADSMLPQEVLVGPAPFCRRLVASHGPWPQYATCKAGAKMLAYLACVSKIVMGLKNETAKAVTLTRRGCGRPARALLAGRWAIPGGAGKPRRCCRGPGCFPPSPARACRPPCCTLVHPPSEPGLPGHDLMPLISPLADLMAPSCSPGAANGERRDPTPAPTFAPASCESPCLIRSHRMEVRGACCASESPQLPHSSNLFKVTQHGRCIRGSGFSLQPSGR